jgi:hypothetical protein
MTANPDFSFHARFTKTGFVSHFTPIPLKRETKGLSRGLSPMRHPGESMKRTLSKIEGLVSPKLGLVSPRFMFRFTPFLWPKH